MNEAILDKGYLECNNTGSVGNLLNVELAKNLVGSVKGKGNELSFPREFIINTHHGFIICHIVVFPISAPFKGT